MCIKQTSKPVIIKEIMIFWVAVFLAGKGVSFQLFKQTKYVHNYHRYLTATTLGLSRSVGSL